MTRLAGCLVVSFAACAAAWVGCRGPGDDPEYAIGSGTDVVDAIVIDDGSGSGGEPAPDVIVVDAGSGGEPAPDVIVVDAGSGGEPTPDVIVVDAGSGGEPTPDAIDAPPPPDAKIDAAPPIDAMIDAAPTDPPIDAMIDAAAPEDALARGDALRAGEAGPLDRTSFYACAGGPAPAGWFEVGLPIAAALTLALRRRRRWRA
jgi:hypothetical protein